MDVTLHVYGSIYSNRGIPTAGENKSMIKKKLCSSWMLHGTSPKGCYKLQGNTEVKCTSLEKTKRRTEEQNGLLRHPHDLKEGPWPLASYQSLHSQRPQSIFQIKTNKQTWFGWECGNYIKGDGGSFLLGAETDMMDLRLSRQFHRGSHTGKTP